MLSALFFIYGILKSRFRKYITGNKKLLAIYYRKKEPSTFDKFISNIDGEMLRNAKDIKNNLKYNCRSLSKLVAQVISGLFIKKMI